MELTDALLMERWHNERDPDAFTEIVNRYWHATFFCCRRILRDSGQAEDIAQECFIELMRSRAPVRSSLGALLHTMSVRRCVDKIKAESRRRSREKVFTGAGLESVAAPDLSYDDIIVTVDEAIEQLPKSTRLLVVARFFEGKTHAEIGEALGVSEATVRYRLKGAIEDIRRTLRRLGVVAGAAAVAEALEAPAAGTTAGIPVRVLSTLSKLAISTPPVASVLATLSFGGTTKFAAALVAVALAGAGLWIGLGIKGDTTRGAGEIRPLVGYELNAGLSGPGQIQAAPSSSPELAHGAPAAVAERPHKPVHSISGRIYDSATGAGLAGVKGYVEAEDGRHEVALDTESGPGGTFCFGPLPDGDYTVFLYMVPGYPTSSNPRAKVLLRNGVPATGVDFSLARGAFVRGRVVDVLGKPVSGADVQAKARTETSTPWPVKSDSAGMFAICMLPGAGEVSVQARNDGYRSDLVSAGNLNEDGVDGVTIVLDQPKTGIVSGVVADGAGTAIAKATLYLYHLSPYLFGFEQICTTDNFGRFRMERVGPGDYSIVVSIEEGIEHFRSSEEYARVKLEAGECVEGLAVVYGERGGMAIAGHVVAGDGKPVNGAWVCVADEHFRGAYTDESGAFTVTGLSDEEHAVTVEHEAHSTAHVTLRAGTFDALVVLKEVCAISGKVVRADTGAPVTDFTLSSLGGTADTLNSMLYEQGRPVTSEDGQFRLDRLSEGDCTVAVWAKGLAPQVRHLQIKAGKETPATFRLDAARLVEGTVADHEGRPVPGAQIYFGKHISIENIRRASVATSNNEGGFTVESLPSEAENLYAFMPGHGIGVEAVSDGMEIVLPPPATVKGTAINDVREPNRIQVNASYPDEPSFPHSQLPLDEDGTFKLTDLTGGVLRIYLWYSQGRGIARQVEISSGTTSSVDFPSAHGTACVTGRITEQGQPVARAMVELVKQDGDMTLEVRTRTGADGKFAFDEVWPGTAELTVRRFSCKEAEPFVDTFQIQAQADTVTHAEIELGN